MKYLLFYEASYEAGAEAQEQLAAHLAWVQEFHDRGELELVGSYADEPPRALGVFTSREAAESFVDGDPLVRHGVVASWQIRAWEEVLSERPAAAAAGGADLPGSITATYTLAPAQARRAHRIAYAGTARWHWALLIFGVVLSLVYDDLVYAIVFGWVFGAYHYSGFRDYRSYLASQEVTVTLAEEGFSSVTADQSMWFDWTVFTTVVCVRSYWVFRLRGGVAMTIPMEVFDEGQTAALDQLLRRKGLLRV